MRDLTKKRIRSIVRAYRDLFPNQYRLGALGNRERAENQKTDWGEVQETSILEREMLRLPTALHEILQMKLTPEEIHEFESEAGTIWFQRTFPEWVPNRKVE
jgi:hypothetical protein